MEKQQVAKTAKTEPDRQQNASNAPETPVNALQQLQRTLGNQGVQSLLRSAALPDALYRCAGSKGPKRDPKPAPTLPDGQVIGFLSNGVIVIRTSWWLEGVTIEKEGGKSKKVKMTNPAKYRELLTQMRQARYYWWMTDEQLAYIAENFALYGSELDPDERFFTMTWGKGILAVIGPPPGSEFMFQRAGDDIRVVIRSSSVSSAPVTDQVEAKLSRELRIRLLNELDKFTGVVSAESGRANFVDVDQVVLIDKEPHAGSLLLMTKSTLDAIYQPDRYKIFLDKKSPGIEQPKPVKQFPTGGGVTITYDADVSNADMEYASKWLETVRGAPYTQGSGGPQIAGKTYYKFEIDMMREIDQSPRKAEILAKLGGYGGSIDSFAMRWAINAAEYEASSKALGVQAAPTGGKRFFPEKVEGHIIVEGLAYPGRENRIWFRKSNPQDAFLFEIVRTQWVIEKQKADNSWEKIRGPEETVEFCAREPNYFKFSFPEVGLYRINAFVNHNWFFPAHITEQVEVKSEEQRLTQVKSTAFAGMGEQKVTKERKDFDTSLFNEAFGPERFDIGKEFGGDLPADWQRMSDDDRLKFITTDKSNLEKLISQYDKPDAPYAHRKLADYAKCRLESLKEQEGKISSQKKEGYVFFEARGAYLSRTEGVPDGPLKLVGMSKGDPEKVVVRVHDFTRLFEPEDFTFEGEGKDFDKAAEEVFLKICKRYPKGQMSVLFERMNNANLSCRQTGVKPETIGWQLDTNTAWKAVRSVVWDPAATIVVNLAGAALIIFAPPTAAIVLPVLAVYNSLETVSKMSDLKDSGNLTFGAFSKGVAEIGLNVLPVISEFKAVSIAARAAAVGARATTAERVVLYGLQGVTVGGMAVLMTAEGVEQCKKLQQQDVSEVARLMAKLDDVRKRNPNAPEIAGLEADLKKASDQALKRSEETFNNMVKSLAIILVPTAAMSKIAKTMAGKNLSALIEEGRFVHQDGVPPHYDPVQGVMVGDRTKVTIEVLDGLKAQYAADQGIKQVQLEKLAGTDKVEIKYGKDVKEVSVAKNADSGVIIIRAPEGTPFEKVLKDAWDSHFSRQPGAPGDMPALTAREPEAVASGKAIAARSGVQVGRKLETAAEGEALLRRLADGDRTAFGALGAEAPGRGFDQQKIEWGLGRTGDGKYVIIRGDEGFIDWSKTPGVKPVAHTHPMSQSKKLSGWNITFYDLVKGAGENAANADKVMPTPADIKFMVENGLTSHTVQTPYVHKGKGVIGNPTRGVAEPKIDIEIVAPEQTGLWKGMSDVPVYKAKFRAKSGDSVIWESDVWATHHPETGSQLMFREPSSDVMTKPKPGVPGTVAGGGTRFSEAHGFTPANEVQQRALDDWEKLQKSLTPKMEKVTWEDWLYRYEKQGWFFDVEGSRKWKSAEGKVKPVEKFEGPDVTAAKVVKRLTTEGAGPGGSTSTFKSFFETIRRRGLVRDEAALEAFIERNIEYKDRSVDFVRHKIKEYYKPLLMDQASPRRWDAARLSGMQKKYPDLPWAAEPAKAGQAAGHREISDVVRELDSSDKGPMMEQWLQENVFPDARKQVEAVKGEVDRQLKPGEELGENTRKIDLLDNETAIEVKTVNDKLPASEASLDPGRKPASQLLDYLRMISSEVRITVKGQGVPLKKLKYVFTTAKGAISNLDTIRNVLKDPAFKGKVTFDVYSPDGIRYTLTSLADLAKPELAWLKK